jgi:hypothetical protein
MSDAGAKGERRTRTAQDEAITSCFIHCNAARARASAIFICLKDHRSILILVLFPPFAPLSHPINLRHALIHRDKRRGNLERIKIHLEEIRHPRILLNINLPCS